MRKTAKKRADVTDTYFALVQRFPLRAVKSEREYAAAREFLIAASMRHQGTRDAGVLDYMETLAKLIEDYEKHAGHGVNLSKLTPVSAINHLMEVHGFNVTQMAEVMGTSQGTLSEIRRGHRGISKEMIRKLVDRFGVNARVFL